MNNTFGKKRYIFFFVAPAFILYAVFGLFPILNNAYFSMFKTNLMEVNKFVGFKNYINLFNDPFFKKAILNNLKFVLGCYIAHMGIALFVSALLFQNVKGAKIFQSVFFMPSVICGTAIGMLWGFIYHPNFGLVNQALIFLGLEEYTHVWLSDAKTVMVCIVIISMWQFIGYHTVIQLAGLRNIDKEIFEAASIDGAGKWKQFFYISLPMIKEVLKIDSILIVIGAWKAYDLVVATTGGGPNHASEVMSTYMYSQGFGSLKFGYSSAISMIMLVICILSTTIIKIVFGERRKKNA